MKLQRSSNMKSCISYLAITMALLSFAFGQPAMQSESENSKSEQEIRQMIEKYRTAMLRRDIPTLQKIWADDYIFVNASGDVLTKAQRLANAKSGTTTLESINEEEILPCAFIKTAQWRRAVSQLTGNTAVNR